MEKFQKNNNNEQCSLVVNMIENCDFVEAAKVFNTMSEKDKYYILRTCSYDNMYPHTFMQQILQNEDSMENRLMDIYVSILQMQANKDNYILVEEAIEAARKIDPKNLMLMRYIVMVYNYQTQYLKALKMFSRLELQNAVKIIKENQMNDKETEILEKDLAKLDSVDDIINKNERYSLKRY